MKCMLTKDIIDIIEKYQNENIISTINSSIEEIISALYSINDGIVKQVSKLLTDKNTNNNIIELTQDSVSLRNYINSIKFVGGTEDIQSTIEQNVKQNEVKQLESVEELFDKYVYPYLISTPICPFCNEKLHPHRIYYQKSSQGYRIEENLEGYRCSICHKLYVLEQNIKNFDTSNTNIRLNRRQYIPEIDFYSVVVLCNTFKCSNDHHTKDIIAKIPTINEDGELSFVEINASYCFECRRFTILKYDFSQIKDVILCKVIDESTTYEPREVDAVEREQKSSILFNYGYNVKSKNSISKEQRHIILASILESNIMTKRDIINHITTLIDRGSKISSWKNATQKWKDDREYVNNYQNGDLSKVIIDNVILKYCQSA